MIGDDRVSAELACVGTRIVVRRDLSKSLQRHRGENGGTPTDIAGQRAGGRKDMGRANGFAIG
ncbi:hypothetical protein CBM2585_A50055 [Cupriavidus taiwanensis]|nr:hypothetical protein CBM2585_A50055 [Cupriavidus taiwanensis]